MQHVLRLLVHHGRDERLVKRGVAEPRSQPLAPEPGLLAPQVGLRLMRNVARRVVAHLVIEHRRAVELEDEEEERQGNHGKGLDVGKLSTHPGGEEEDEIGQQRAEDEAVEQDPPKLAAGFRFGDEDVKQQILPQHRVDGKVNRRRRQDERLNARVGKSNGGIEEEVVVVTSVIESGRRRELDQLTRGRAGKVAHEEAVDQRPQLRQVDGHTEMALKQPGNPEGAD